MVVTAFLPYGILTCVTIVHQDEIIPVDGKVAENGIKGDTNMEKVSKLSPAFIKPHGKERSAVKGVRWH